MDLMLLITAQVEQGTTGENRYRAGQMLIRPSTINEYQRVEETGGPSWMDTSSLSIITTG